MTFYFEFYDNAFEIPTRCEIFNEGDGYYLYHIEQPSDDRRLLAHGDSIAELVDWALNNC